MGQHLTMACSWLWQLWGLVLGSPQHIPSPHKWAQGRLQARNVMCNGNIGARLRSHNLRALLLNRNLVTFLIGKSVAYLDFYVIAVFYCNIFYNCEHKEELY
jgi:hypothetical protein